MSRGELTIEDNQVKAGSGDWANEYQQQYNAGPSSWADQYAHEQASINFLAYFLFFFCVRNLRKSYNC